jgi:hypothetical protein
MGYMHSRNNSAISELVGYILVLMIVVSSLSVIMLWYMPYIEELEVRTQANNIFKQFTSLNDAMLDLASQGEDASTFYEVALEEGRIDIESTGERIVIYYSLYSDPTYDFYVNGLADTNLKFNVRLFGGSALDNCRAEAVKLNDFEEAQSSEITIDSVDPWEEFDLSGNPNIDSITGSFRIDLNHTTTSTIFGRIWVFDTGCISYDLPSSFGTYRVVAENGGVIFGYPASSYLKDQPLVYNKSNVFVLRIMQINPEGGYTGGSGAGNYRFSMNLNNSLILGSKNSSYNFRMQIYNDQSEKDEKAWFFYFTQFHEFKYVSAVQVSNTIEIPNSEVVFSLLQSVCDVYLEGVT